MTTARLDGEPRERAARPILLTVDDDPSVSRAVARDLRRHYGADYRVVRADSGGDALELIRDVVLAASRWRSSWPTTGCRG
jgi:thioredoxin reductase (NADPH)